MGPLVESSVREAAAATMQPVQEALVMKLQDILRENFERALQRYVCRGRQSSRLGFPGPSTPQPRTNPSAPPEVEDSLQTVRGSSSADIAEIFDMDKDEEVETSFPWLQPLDTSFDGGVELGSLDFDMDDQPWMALEDFP